jgi:phage terminase large subunit-like protein
MSVDPHAYRNWTPEAQKRAADILAVAKERPWHAFYCPAPDCDGRPHVAAPPCEVDIYGHWWMREGDTDWFRCDEEFGCGARGRAVDAWDFPHARKDQRPPNWAQRWMTWLIMSGRGGGKTETGSRLTHRVAKKVPRMILVAATGPDFRDIMVEGVSGILATAPPGERPEWEPSKKKLTFPNGAIAQGYSAEEPDRLRGPQSGYIWMDEAAHFDLVDKVWDNALFGLRLGKPSHVVLTSTPKPTKWLKERVADPKTIVTRVATYANLYNLDPAYREFIIDKYQGTRLGRQELEGELLTDVEGALWNYEMFTYGPIPELERVVVAVDPAGTAERRSDETGIVVVGIAEGTAYVLADYTDRYSPAAWGNKVWWAHEKWQADAIVAEKNYGGDMVKHVLDSATDGKARVTMVTSRRGKVIRAEPIVAQYEKQRVVHTNEKDALQMLEDEQTSWVPGHGASPNRVDALVHGLTNLFKGAAPASIASASEILKEARTPVPRFQERRLPWML